MNSAELLSTELFSADPDECIGYGKTDAAPPWILIGLAAVFMLFGVDLAAAGCSPMLFSQLPAEARGGAVGVGVGVIMAMFAALLVHSAKSKAIVHGVRFYKNGIRLHGSRNETLQPYVDLEQLHVVAIRPGRRLSVRGVLYSLSNHHVHRHSRQISFTKISAMPWEMRRAAHTLQTHEVDRAMRVR